MAKQNNQRASLGLPTGLGLPQVQSPAVDVEACKGCFYWHDEIEPGQYGECRAKPPAVHSGVALTGPVHRYIVTSASTGACGEAKPRS